MDPFGKTYRRNTGSALLLTIFAVALFSVLVAGMLELNAEEIQLVQNFIEAARSQYTAEAGLYDAVARLRGDPEWRLGFVQKPFEDGSYTVTVTHRPVTATSHPTEILIKSTGQCAAGFVTTVLSDVTIDKYPPHKITIDNFRINE